MKKIVFIGLLISLAAIHTQAQEKKLRQEKTISPSPQPVPVIPIPGAIQPARVATESNYETVPDDPMKVRIYTLKNGLKVYLSVNKDAPRIQTLIAVKAGSKYDPPQTTGLAHYLEHMVFKGTSEFSTANWASEKVLLDSIAANFEYHRSEKDETKKKQIYARIDSFSYEASKFAIPNEYDKMMTSLGAQGTNAFTSTDMTVYVNDIPSNAIEKFLKLESNRFQQLVLRLFHTELETVYEEFNRSQDNDSRWSYQNVINALLPNHPYGTQTTIGEGEHLKNPSMVNIHNYFNTYYRPNNVAIIMAGDFDPDKTIQLIEQYFGSWQAAPIPNFIQQPAPEIKEPITREYYGPQPEHVYVGFRFNGANTREAMMVKLVDMILANGEAGLIDLDLVQQQKVLQAYSFVDANTDYCFHVLYGEPKQGQKMEDVKDLLLAEIDKIKKGMFGDWLLPAIVQNLRLQRMKAAEKNDERAQAMMNAFIYDIPWKDWLNEVDEMARITKEDIVKFANEHYRQNYAVCYKRQGEAKVHKVEKPNITPVVMNKDISSAYKKNWDAIPQLPIQPKFLDFEKDIKRYPTNIAGVPLHYIHNDLNKTFLLQYIFDMGTDNIRELGLAVDYLQYLGAGKYSAEYIKTEFYKMGVTFSVNSSRDRVSISLTGLEENLQKGVELLEYLLANVKPDKEVYEAMVIDILQKRANAKKNKSTILNHALGNYAKYGRVNPFNTVISEEELKKMSIEKLTMLIKSLCSYKHKIFYYGQNEPQRVLDVLKEFHQPATPLKEYPQARKFPELPITANKVYVCYYPMKQTEVVMLARNGVFNKDLYPYIFLYNEYYGSGLSSIMFQEIREKMALAYAVSSTFGIPQYAHESHYISSYVGTQADKLDTALQEMNRLLNDMPEVEQQFEGAKASLIKSLESDWITRADMYAAYERAQRRGLNYDVRKEVYEKLKSFTIKDLHTFFDNHIKGKNFAYLVIGKKEDVNLNTLKKLGPVEELKLEELFGY